MRGTTTNRNKNLSILFVCPPSSLIPHFQNYLGTGTIIAYLLQHGFAAAQFIAEEPLNVKACVDAIMEKRPRIVGFTVYDSNYAQCQLLAEAIKRVNKQTVVVFGGPTASVQAETVIDHNPFVDVCVRHEGEETVLELVSLLESVSFYPNRASLEGVDGISYRAGDTVLRNPDRLTFFRHRHVPNYLDKYPSPYLTGVITSTDAGLVTARGCNQHCVYCNCAALSQRRITTHSVDRVIEELDCVSRLPVNELFAIYDDAFTLLPSRALEICERIIENKIRLPLHCVTRCDKVDEELLDRMKEAGFQSIGFSLESAVPRILRNIGKVQDPDTVTDDRFEKEKKFLEKFRRYVSYAKKIGVQRVFVSIMLGLPGETRAEAEQTLDAVRSLGSDVYIYAHNIFTIFPGTRIFDEYKKHGYEIRKYRSNIHYKTIHPVDPYAISVEGNAMHIRDGCKEHTNTMRYLSLSASSDGTGNFFRAIVLDSDVVTEGHVRWFQDVLAIHGKLILVYSGAESAEENHEANVEALLEHRSPVTAPFAYYRKEHGGGMTLVSYRVQKVDEKYLPAIHLIPVVADHPDGDSAAVSPDHCLAIENAARDTVRLHEILIECSRKRKSGAGIGDCTIFPYFANLCRWESGAPNCRRLEIAFVDRDGSVKTCWSGEPVGCVGMPFAEIIVRSNELRSRAEHRRNCRDCEKKEGCPKCIFPHPISEREFCALNREFDSREAADLVRSLDMFKGFIPILGRSH